MKFNTNIFLFQFVLNTCEYKIYEDEHAIYHQLYQEVFQQNNFVQKIIPNEWKIDM